LASRAGSAICPPTCNDFGNRTPYDEYLRAFSQIRVPLKWPKAAPNLEPRDDIWPTDPAPIIRRHEEDVELVQLRWGLCHTFRATGITAYLSNGGALDGLASF